jgi:ribonuclease BN (tRNA processing enzyme)
MTGKQAGAAAAEAGVGRLVLTHIPPWHDPDVCLGEAREAFAGPVELAATGASYIL